MKRLIFWDFPRASWQYDVVVALILAFLFFTPREWFRDQPRQTQISLMAQEQGHMVYLFEPRLFQDVPETERGQKASDLLKARFGKRPKVTKVEAVLDTEEELVGYKIFTQP